MWPISLVLVMAGLGVVGGSRTHSVLSLLDQWRRWRGHGFGTPTATAADESLRFGLFLVHMMPLARNRTYQVGATPYADMSFGEWAAIWTEHLDRQLKLPASMAPGPGHGLRRQGENANDDRAVAILGSSMPDQLVVPVSGTVQQSLLTWPRSRLRKHGCGRPAPCSSLR